MKKFLSGLIILIVIISTGLLSISYFKSSSGQLTKPIEQTYKYITQGSWENAKSSIEGIEKKWNNTENTWSLLTDHIEVDNIEMTMKKAMEYIETKNTSQALAELKSLEFAVKHIYEKEKFNLKNIF